MKPLLAPVLAALCALLAGLAGCSDSTLRMESDLRMEGKMEGNMQAKLDGAMRIEGPIQIQMQMTGPSVQYTGVYISEALLDRVDVDETTSEWVLAVFGPPTTSAALSDGTEIWKWEYKPLTQEGSLVTVLQTGGKDEPQVSQSTVFLQIRQGVVIDKWRD